MSPAISDFVELLVKVLTSALLLSCVESTNVGVSVPSFREMRGGRLLLLRAKLSGTGLSGVADAPSCHAGEGGRILIVIFLLWCLADFVKSILKICVSGTVSPHSSLIAKIFWGSSRGGDANAGEAGRILIVIFLLVYLADFVKSSLKICVSGTVSPLPHFSLITKISWGSSREGEAGERGCESGQENEQKYYLSPQALAESTAYAIA
jgi:hypothetical protein